MFPETIDTVSRHAKTGWGPWYQGDVVATNKHKRGMLNYVLASITKENTWEQYMIKEHEQTLPPSKTFLSLSKVVIHVNRLKVNLVSCYCPCQKCWTLSTMWPPSYNSLYRLDLTNLIYPSSTLQREAPRIAKSVYKSNNYGLWTFMVFITIVTGAYKPTYNWGASHCSYIYN